MMKVSIQTSTGLLIESQSNATGQTLIENAAAIGIASSDVEIRIVTDAELNLLIAARENANKTTTQIAKELEQAVDRHIDAVAQSDKWDSRITCVMRAGYPNPWQAKAVAFSGWMDSCYAHCIQVQLAVAAGTRAVPTSAELIAELPVMVWPA
jgi:hypothetical protein